MNDSGHVERFVKAVHRRMVLLRAAERLGLCVLGGCAVLLILMPILIWRGQETGQLALLTFCISAVAGLAWGIASRPTQLAAASEADRQLKLSDLLGTALLLGRSGAGDEMERIVLALAEAKSAQASPSAVVLHRFGARGWGGIGLAAALVAGLYLMGPDNARSQARAAGPKSWQDVELETDKANATKLASNPDMRRVKPGEGTDDTDPIKSEVSNAEQPGDSVNPKTNSAAQKTDSGTDASTGTGAGQSTAKTSSPSTPDATSSANSTTNKQGETVVGGGTAADNGNASGTTGSTAGTNKPHRPAPVWQSDAWPAAQEAARTALRSGQIPDAYRDLVRDYFERE